MESKRKNLLLVSTIFGGIFAAVFIFILTWAIISTMGQEGDIIDYLTALRNLLFNPIKNFSNEAILALAIFLLVIIVTLITAPFAFVFNLIGWLGNKNKYILTGGILYILSLNIFSAPICFVEHFSAKHTIKNKLLFYTMIYSFIFSILFIISIILLPQPRAGVVLTLSDYSYVFYFIITIGIGIILNFFAWKTGIRKMKLLAGIFYILGIVTIVPAIICFIYFALHKKQAVQLEVKNQV